MRTSTNRSPSWMRVATPPEELRRDLVRDLLGGEPEPRREEGIGLPHELGAAERDVVRDVHDSWDVLDGGRDLVGGVLQNGIIGPEQLDLDGRRIAFEIVDRVVHHLDELDLGLRHAESAEGALARIFALGTSADVAGVWVAGERAA